MKKEIFNIISILILILTLFSCNKEESDVYEESVILKLSESKMTVLDSGISTTIDFVSKTKTVSTVALLVGDKQIASTSASGNKVAVTLKRSDLGLKKVGDKVKLYVNATVDGKVKEMYTTISMVGATEISSPTKVVKDGKGKDKTVADLVYKVSDLVKNFTYSVSAKTIEDVKVTAASKVGANAKYTDLWTKDYNSKDALIGVKGSSYNVNDTVYVKLTAKVGDFTDAVESSIVVMPYDITTGAKMGKVSVQKMGFSLTDNTLCTVTSAACNIQFTHNFAQLYQGFNTLNSTSLVAIPVEDEDLMKETNMPKLKEAFEGGTELTIVEDAKVGSMYLVKVVKDSKDYYGKLTVKSVNTNRTADDDFTEFEYVIEEYDTEI